MNLSRREAWIFFGLGSVFAGLSLWRMQVSPFPAHGDGCWYDMVARNFAAGRGLVEDCVPHFGILRDTVSGPIGNYWNPLAAIMTGLFYKAFGVSDWIGRLPALLMDAAGSINSIAS